LPPSLSSRGCDRAGRTPGFATNPKLVQEGRRQEAGGRRQKAEGRRKEAEERRQKKGGRRKEAEERRQKKGGRRKKQRKLVQ
jgi:hypothetical protein